MRARDFRYFPALLPLCVFAAQEPAAPAATSANLRRTSFHHAVALRDSELDTARPVPWRGSFSLPPGGGELELQPTSSTPYDRFFGSVRAVIASMEPHGATMSTACHLMKVAHSFDYYSRDPYRPDPPKLTEVQHSGDCKSKSLWLLDSLADANALFAIGKSEKNSRTSHAWVYWRSGGRWWILDCTDRADPIAADSVSADRYVPYYSFGKCGTFRHPATPVNPTVINFFPVDPVAAAAPKKSR